MLQVKKKKANWIYKSFQLIIEIFIVPEVSINRYNKDVSSK